MDLELRGKVAIVTGGSRGIGKAIARELAREGASVAIVARGQAALEATADEHRRRNGARVVALAADTARRRSGASAWSPRRSTRSAASHILVNCGATVGSRRRVQAARRDRRRVLGRDERQGAGLPALHPAGGAAHDRAGLGPHHQHQRPGRAHADLHHRQHAQRGGGRADQERRRRAGPARHQRDGRASGRDAHRAVLRRRSTNKPSSAAHSRRSYCSSASRPT